MDNIQAVVFNAGQRLNELTGYSGIEALKMAIEEQGWFSHNSSCTFRCTYMYNSYKTKI